MTSCMRVPAARTAIDALLVLIAVPLDRLDLTRAVASEEGPKRVVAVDLLLDVSRDPLRPLAPKPFRQGLSRQERRREHQAS